MDTKQVTALVKDQLHKRRTFPWGTILDTHVVGPYMVFEYRESKTFGDERRVSFQPYVRDGSKWQDTRSSFSTLDEALATAIAYRIEGPNTHAAGYFIRGLDRS